MSTDIKREIEWSPRRELVEEYDTLPSVYINSYSRYQSTRSITLSKHPRNSYETFAIHWDRHGVMAHINYEKTTDGGGIAQANRYYAGGKEMYGGNMWNGREAISFHMKVVEGLF